MKKTNKISHFDPQVLQDIFFSPDDLLEKPLGGRILHVDWVATLQAQVIGQSAVEDNRVVFSSGVIGWAALASKIVVHDNPKLLALSPAGFVDGGVIYIPVHVLEAELQKGRESARMWLEAGMLSCAQSALLGHTNSVLWPLVAQQDVLGALADHPNEDMVRQALMATQGQHAWRYAQALTCVEDIACSPEWAILREVARSIDPDPGATDVASDMWKVFSLMSTPGWIETLRGPITSKEKGVFIGEWLERRHIEPALMDIVFRGVTLGLVTDGEISFPDKVDFCNGLIAVGTEEMRLDAISNFSNSHAIVSNDCKRYFDKDNEKKWAILDAQMTWLNATSGTPDGYLTSVLELISLKAGKMPVSIATSTKTIAKQLRSLIPLCAPASTSTLLTGAKAFACVVPDLLAQGADPKAFCHQKNMGVLDALVEGVDNWGGWFAPKDIQDIFLASVSANYPDYRTLDILGSGPLVKLVRNAAGQAGAWAWWVDVIKKGVQLSSMEGASLLVALSELEKPQEELVDLIVGQGTPVSTLVDDWKTEQKIPVIELVRKNATGAVAVPFEKHHLSETTKQLLIQELGEDAKQQPSRAAPKM